MTVLGLRPRMRAHASSQRPPRRCTRLHWLPHSGCSGARTKSRCHRTPQGMTSVLGPGTAPRGPAERIALLIVSEPHREVSPTSVQPRLRFPSGSPRTCVEPVRDTGEEIWSVLAGGTAHSRS